MVGHERQKGIGYTIEAFIAVLTLFIFAVGSFQAPAGQDWNRFQAEVAARDIGYVLQETGNTEAFLERGETGSFQTAVSALTQDRLTVSGDVINLPIGEKSIGFHVLDRDIHTFNPQTVSSLGDTCAARGDLEEIDHEYEIKRTQDERHGVYLYLADSDPESAGGSTGTMDYDSLWVDNGTRCQFSSAEGPYLQENFFWWGNSSDSEPDLHYDFKNISSDGSKMVAYEAEQPVQFQEQLQQPVNGVDTDVSVNTFNFSSPNIESYDTLVFREHGALAEINASSEKEERLVDYLKEGSALFLVDLTESNLDSGFMSRTGLSWKDLPFTTTPSGASFTDQPQSSRVENLFLGQSGTGTAVDLPPGGKIESGNMQLVNAMNGRYETDEWNATNMSMDPDPNPPAGVAESSCGNYRHGVFEFPGNDYDAWSSEIGNCADDEHIYALSIDLDDDSTIEENEKTFVNGDELVVNDRKYVARIYPDTLPGCSAGECVEFIYLGTPRVEIVNSRTRFEGTDIGRFARASYESSYSSADRKLLAAVIFWLSDQENSFGVSSSGITTTAVGGIKNGVYMPYRIDLRWTQ
ncbi:MAG: hypothetical protein ABEJ91_02015 [Candidatus Nanohaloarchaea archaeon]